jgi:hypothetical protein
MIRLPAGAGKVAPAAIATSQAATQCVGPRCGTGRRASLASHSIQSGAVAPKMAKGTRRGAIKAVGAAASRIWLNQRIPANTEKRFSVFH